MPEDEDRELLEIDPKEEQQTMAEESSNFSHWLYYQFVVIMI